MTRSGAPFQGANGEGKTENPAASPQRPDAASAGESIVAKMNAAVAAAANRLARSILTTSLEESETALGPARGPESQDSRVDQGQSGKFVAPFAEEASSTSQQTTRSRDEVPPGVVLATGMTTTVEIDDRVAKREP
jgi:hypothetical protein